MKKLLKVVTISTAMTMATSSFAGSITFASWGGTTQEAQKKSWADSFTKKTGIKVRQSGPTNYGKIKTMVESKKVAWDVVDAEIDYAAQACKQGLLEKIDYSIIDKSKLDKRFISKCYVGSFAFSFVIGYDKSAFNKKPNSWKDVFDTNKFPGKRAFYKWAAPGILEAALLADGVKSSNLYPLDLERAFAKLDTIKKDIIWWDGGAKSQQLLASKEVSIGSFWNGRLTALQQSGEDIGISWSQNITSADVLVVPKGTKNKREAMQFIAHAVAAKQQADFSVASGYSPINTHAEKHMTSEQRGELPQNQKGQKINVNLDYWAKNRDTIGKRWYAWQSK